MPPTSQFFQVPASGEFKKLEPVREHRQCLLFLSIILDKNSYPDFFGIMTFYQECCICAISSKKGRDNMGDFSSIYKFF